MKVIYGLAEFIQEYRMAHNIKENGEAIFAGFGSLNFVYRNDEGKDVRVYADLNMIDIDRIVHTLEEKTT